MLLKGSLKLNYLVMGFSESNIVHKLHRFFPPLLSMTHLIEETPNMVDQNSVEGKYLTETNVTLYVYITDYVSGLICICLHLKPSTHLALKFMILFLQLTNFSAL